MPKMVSTKELQVMTSSVIPTLLSLPRVLHGLSCLMSERCWPCSKSSRPQTFVRIYWDLDNIKPSAKSKLGSELVRAVKVHRRPMPACVACFALRCGELTSPVPNAMSSNCKSEISLHPPEHSGRGSQ